MITFVVHKSVGGISISCPHIQKFLKEFTTEVGIVSQCCGLPIRLAPGPDWAGDLVQKITDTYP